MALKRLSLAIFNDETKIGKRKKINVKIGTPTKKLSTKQNTCRPTHTQNTDYQTQRSRNGRKPLEIMTKIYFKHFSRAHFFGATLKAYQAFHCPTKRLLTILRIFSHSVELVSVLCHIVSTIYY